MLDAENSSVVTAGGYFCLFFWCVFFASHIRPFLHSLLSIQFVAACLVYFIDSSLRNLIFCGPVVFSKRDC